MAEDIREHPLLNPNIQMNFWQECLKQAIIDMHSIGGDAPYALGGHGGSTEDIWYKGPGDKQRSRILTAGDPVRTYCCGATLEAFLRAWKYYMKEYWDQSFSVAQAKELRSHFFVYEQQYVAGSGGGLLWLARQDPCADFLEVEDWTEDPKNIPWGAFVQIQFGRKYDDGHSVISLGTTKHKKRDVLLCYSSNRYYDKRWKYSKDQTTGLGFDYYYIDSVRDGFQRIFHSAEILDDDYESMPDTK